MKRNAFTLVEVLVVIAVIALLMAIAVPSMSAAKSYGRATICRNNLRNISTAFSVARHQNPCPGQASMIYPEWSAWPGSAYMAVSSPELFKCPEADVTEEFVNTAAGLEYRNMDLNRPNGVIVKLSVGMCEYFISRPGADVGGKYTEYLIQDDGNAPNDTGITHWSDVSDALFRIYESGMVWIVGAVPAEPGFPQTSWNNNATYCGEANALYLDGRPAFGIDGIFNKHRGEKFQLGVWGTGPTNYGINTYAYLYPFGARAVVLLDFDQINADPDWRGDLMQSLGRSGRHRGQLNVLYADGAVRARWPLELDPEYTADWNPSKLTK